MPSKHRVGGSNPPGDAKKDSWVSGLNHLPAKEAYVKAYRGFESHTVRQFVEVGVKHKVAVLHKS